MRNSRKIVFFLNSYFLLLAFYLNGKLDDFYCIPVFVTGLAEPSKTLFRVGFATVMLWFFEDQRILNIHRQCQRIRLETGLSDYY
jgi:hypothetical protein